MSKLTTSQEPQKSSSNLTAAPSSILQRKCACGNHTVAGGECTQCGKEKNLQRKSHDRIESGAGISLRNIPFIQTKLTVGASNDPLEQEADRIANQVLAAPAHPAVSGAPPRIQRYTGQATEGTENAPASVDRVLTSSGRPLHPALQQDMGQRFGHDFSRVRVHAGTDAEQSARDVNANAYTVGHNIVFGAGQFAPGTQAGRRLIAHELTHVVQQGYGVAISGLSVLEVDRSDSTAEQAADAAEHAVNQGKPVRVAGTGMTRLNRKESKPPTPVNHGKMSFSMEEDPAKGREYVTIVFSPDPKGPQTKSINLIQIAKVVFDNGSKWSDQQPKQAALERFTTGTGFHVDVKPDDLAPPRKQKTDPNISPAYPPASVKDGSKTETDPLSGLTRNVSHTLAPQPGHNLPGDMLDASINDSPGGGISSGVWEMETVAHSDDLGINYGAVRWSFRYAGPGMRPLYTQEKSEISATVSSNVKESLIAFNKYYMNKHIVQKGETLKSISIDYYGDDSQVASIFAINKQALTDANPEALIPVGTELEMTGRKWEHVKSTPKQNMWERAKKTGHGAE